MTVRELFERTRHRLLTYFGAGEARETALLIFENLKGWSMTDILLKGDSETTDWLQSHVQSAVERVLAGEPVQYVFGKAHFYGLVLKVTPDVLIPRPETAELVDMIVDTFKDKTDLRVLDIATGSGCIAVALARNLKFAGIDAFDISPKALDVARENASQLKVKVNFSQGDILALPSDPEPSYDIIVCNPPYIALGEARHMELNVLDHEPHEALFVPDNDPLKFYRPVCRYALKALDRGGRLYLEINPLYADMLRNEMLTGGWNDVDVVTDMQGRQRFIIAEP